MPRRSPEVISRGETDTFQDLRSFKRSQNRQSKQSAKYYGYRAVDPGWVDKPYLSLSPSGQKALCCPKWNSLDTSCAPLVSHPQHMKPSTWTKRDMWNDRESNILPLDRRHHKGKRIREKCAWEDTQMFAGRRMKQRTRALKFACEEAEMEAREDEGLCIQEIEECLVREFQEYLNEYNTTNNGLYMVWSGGARDLAWEGGSDFGGAEICEEEEEEVKKEEEVAEPPPHTVSSSEPASCSENNSDEDVDVDGFNIISERDFDVMSIDSIDDDYPG